MPDATPITFNHENKSQSELQARRQEIITIMQRDYKGYADPAVPMELLQELAVVTGTLRRKNAGPPKTEKVKRTTSKTTIDDLLV